MLLRIIPFVAVTLTLFALLFNDSWLPAKKDGLSAPAHRVSGLF